MLLGLVYSTKPDTNAASITLARSGDTAVVIDTSRSRAGLATAGTAPDRTAGMPALPMAAATPPGVSGSSFPAIVPGDLTALREQGPTVPVAGITSEKLVDSFDDMRGGTRRHNAIDIMAARNTPVVATTAGRILKLHNSVAGGLTVYATDATSRYIFLYGHLDSYRPGLTEGMAVKRGDIIGFVGSTGNAVPAGPHLHFAITRSDNVQEWWKGTPLNPFLVYRSK